MKRFTYLFPLLFLMLSNSAFAAINNKDILDNVLEKYRAVASTWQGVIMSNALWLFWCLVAISMVWTFAQLILKQADFGEFFGELIRFMMFTGFYLWILQNAPEIGSSIIKSMGQLAAKAAGISDTPSPSSIVDIGFDIFNQVANQTSVWSPVDSAMGMILALIILVIIALLAINMLLLLITSWVLLYAGIFFLGFGGSKWTSDMAINYYKTLLGIAIQIFTMVLLIGIGKSIVDQYYTNMSDSIIFSELAVMFIVALTLLLLVNKLPPLMAGIITGASVGGQGIGSFASGAVLGAAATTAAGFGVASQLVTSGAANAGGGAKAIMEAFRSASGESSEGSLSGDAGSGSSSGMEGSLSSGSGDSDTPLSSAMGDDSSSGSIVSSGDRSFAAAVSDGIKNLATGVKDTAKDAMNARINQTVGGQVAEKIKSNREDKL
ncbi:P-type conjugative transfer protein TrbL [Zophobihabitans entericus]|uniref:P-type conjugative transfer protein TrbL n=1 Tax=Zophobihabitans entericus TaxID=1635327 RepID=A0A6G9IE52_9GAMM|nr:P-type conjugative transfer protein TrbL [Zophobihabitans entericus]QIQ22515.1 P-type conjugative transfer protein TrbL [Zophobihabitans entericus]